MGWYIKNDQATPERCVYCTGWVLPEEDKMYFIGPDDHPDGVSHGEAHALCLWVEIEEREKPDVLEGQRLHCRSRYCTDDREKVVREKWPDVWSARPRQDGQPSNAK